MESGADLALKCVSGAVVGTPVVGTAVVGTAAASQNKYLSNYRSSELNKHIVSQHGQKNSDVEIKDQYTISHKNYFSPNTVQRTSQGCRGYGDSHGDSHGYGYGMGMGIKIQSPRQPWN